MRRIVFALLLMFLTAPARAENPATASLDCAPWQGKDQELNLTVGWPESTAKIRVWGRGFFRLQNGAKAVEIDNISSPHGTGKAEICGAYRVKSCDEKSLGLEFKTIDLKPGGKIEGFIKLKDNSKVPFTGTISSQQVKCE